MTAFTGTRRSVAAWLVVLLSALAAAGCGGSPADHTVVSRPSAAQRLARLTPRRRREVTQIADVISERTDILTGPAFFSCTLTGGRHLSQTALRSAHAQLVRGTLSAKATSIRLIRTCLAGKTSVFRRRVRALYEAIARRDHTPARLESCISSGLGRLAAGPYARILAYGHAAALRNLGQAVGRFVLSACLRNRAVNASYRAWLLRTAAADAAAQFAPRDNTRCYLRMVRGLPDSYFAFFAKLDPHDLFWVLLTECGYNPLPPDHPLGPTALVRAVDRALA